MINPHKITNFNRTYAELQELLLFAVAVAGKAADMQARKLEEFLQGREPFRYVRSLMASDQLERALREVKLGKYKLLADSFDACSKLGERMLRTLTSAQLQALPGVGWKTAKFFILHSRAGVREAVLDRHVMKFLRKRHPLAPKGLPTSTREYMQWEAVFLGECFKEGITDIAQADLTCWTTKGERIIDYVGTPNRRSTTRPRKKSAK